MIKELDIEDIDVAWNFFIEYESDIWTQENEKNG